MDNKNTQMVVSRYLQLTEKLNDTTDINARNELLQEIEVIKKTLNTYIEVQLKLGKVNEDFITFVSNIDSLGILYNDIDLGNISPSYQARETNSKNELFCNRIKSDLTDEEISLVGFSTYKRIELIYVHTGTIITSSDKALIASRDAAFNSFINNLCKYTSPAQLISLYGAKWMEEVEKVYKEGYERAINSHINQIVENIDTKNREKVMELEQQLFASEQEEIRLQQETEQLRKEVAVLTAKVLEINQENKEELLEYRESLISMIDGKNNFEFTPEEKTKILGALGIQFEYDENKRNGIGIDNDYTLAIELGTPVELTARHMMVCKNLGINVVANLNGTQLDNRAFQDEQQVLEAYNHAQETHKVM